VFCPTFTFCATAEVVVLTGATPVLVDVEGATFNIDPASLTMGIMTAKSLGLKPKAVIPVGLFGQPADLDAVNAIAKAEGLFVFDDAAQSFGATYKGRSVGTLADATATSFFPAKPLGCYGDGGAIFTDDAQLAEVLVSLRVHGQGSDKYDNLRIGLNGRLDTLQAAILLEKLKIFRDELGERDRIAKRYATLLGDVVTVPVVADEATSVWAQYTIRVPAGRRDRIVDELKGQGIPTAIYYAKPLHRQTAYKHYPIAGNGLPVSDRLAGEVLSLPMHPYLTETVQDHICAGLRHALGKV
jgi:dTDP-4-amino-4,6-dideoxygalactose transaminase